MPSYEQSRKPLFAKHVKYNQTNKRSGDRSRAPWLLLIIFAVAIALFGTTSCAEKTSDTSSIDSSSDKSKVVVDRSVLQTAYDEASSIDPERLARCTQESQDALAKALAEAKIVLDNEEATNEECLEAWNKIVDATTHLKAASSSNEDNAAKTKTPNDEPQEPKVSAEYKSALKAAQRYNDTFHMSKAGLYDQLTSEYGSQFTEDAAQYAIDNLDADWNANALATAKYYQENMAMSTAAIYDQLVSEYGDKFTADEAQYAIDHLND